MQQRDADGLETILRRAKVLSPQAFAAPGDGGGEDVFVCEYQYDSAWQVGGLVCADSLCSGVIVWGAAQNGLRCGCAARPLSAAVSCPRFVFASNPGSPSPPVLQRFRRLTEFDGDSDDEGEEWAPEGGSDGVRAGVEQRPDERGGRGMGRWGRRGGKFGKGGAASTCCRASAADCPALLLGLPPLLPSITICSCALQLSHNNQDDDEEAFLPGHELLAEKGVLPGGAQRRKGGAGGAAAGINRLRCVSQASPRGWCVRRSPCITAKSCTRIGVLASCDPGQAAVLWALHRPAERCPLTAGARSFQARWGQRLCQSMRGGGSAMRAAPWGRCEGRAWSDLVLHSVAINRDAAAQQLEPWPRLAPPGTAHCDIPPPHPLPARPPRLPVLQARRALTLAAVPRSLPCREDERKQIVDFVEEVLEEGERL